MDVLLQIAIIIRLCTLVYPQRCEINLDQLVCYNVILKSAKLDIQGDPNKINSIKFLDSSISMVQSGAFTNYKNTTTIYLNNSNVNNIEIGVFEGMANLKELYIFENNIEEIKPGAFDPLTDLKTLNLEYNKIVKLEPGTFDLLLNMEKLNLHQNSIREISLGTFNSLTRLKKLNVQNNQLNEINKNCFANMTSLQTLYLGNNDLKSIPENTFDDLSNLENLYLSNNLIYRLDQGCFKNQRKLFKLHLDHNLLTMFDCTIFLDLRSLVDFNLQNNKLSVIPDNCFRNSNNLKGLFINNNRLASINAEEFLSYHPKLDSISLNNNRWKCDILQDIVETFLNHSVLITDGITTNSKNIEGIACKETVEKNKDPTRLPSEADITENEAQSSEIVKIKRENSAQEPPAVDVIIFQTTEKTENNEVIFVNNKTSINLNATRNLKQLLNNLEENYMEFTNNTTIVVIVAVVGLIVTVVFLVFVQARRFWQKSAKIEKRKGIGVVRFSNRNFSKSSGVATTTKKVTCS